MNHNFFESSLAGGGPGDFAELLHKWVDGRTKAPIQYKNNLTLGVSSPNNQDMLWLTEHTSVPAK